MQNKSLIDQIREAEMINIAMKWGLPSDFFRVKLSNLDFGLKITDRLEVFSSHFPEADGLNSLYITFSRLIEFIEKRAKWSKMKFSIAGELSRNNICGRLHLFRGEHKPGAEVVSFDCRDNYNHHDGVIVGDLLKQAEDYERFISVQALWALVFFPERFKKMDGENGPGMALAGYSFWPTRSYGDIPKTIVITGSSKDISIGMSEVNRPILFSAPRVQSLC